MRLLCILFCLVNSLNGYSQADAKPIVGVAEFTAEVDSKFANAVAEKVVQVVTNTKRFTVVDRTSYEKVREELEFQKSEAFLDSKNRIKQDAALAAQYMIIGHIVKMNVYAMKNDDGSVKGYKSSAAFTLKVNDVESGSTTEATSFQTQVSPLMFSPESAVNEALKSIESDLTSYFLKTFPLKTRIVKIIEIKKDAAVKVLISGGTAYGLTPGDKLSVEKIELIEGMPYPIQIGELKVLKIAGDDFSECAVQKGGKEILSGFSTAEKLSCKLIMK